MLAVFYGCKGMLMGYNYRSKMHKRSVFRLEVHRSRIYMYSFCKSVSKPEILLQFPRRKGTQRVMSQGLCG